MTERKLSLPEFDGASDKYQLRNTKFMAYAGMCGFHSALKDGGEAEMPLTNATTFDLTTDAREASWQSKEKECFSDG